MSDTPSHKVCPGGPTCSVCDATFQSVDLDDLQASAIADGQILKELEQEKRKHLEERRVKMEDKLKDIANGTSPIDEYYQRRTKRLEQEVSSLAES